MRKGQRPARPFRQSQCAGRWSTPGRLFVNLARGRGVGEQVELQGTAGRDHAVARVVAGDSRLCRRVEKLPLAMRG